MFYILDKSFWHEPWLVVFFLSTLLAIIFIRYVAFASLYQMLLASVKKSTINIYSLKRNQIRKEIKWSFLSSVVFTIFSAISYWGFQKGWTMVYTEVSSYPLWYFFVSPFILLILYETYYYWLHRAMHIPLLFKIIHKAHHESLHPTVFTSFAFHPLEAILQFLFFPIVIILIPFHYYILMAVLLLMTLSAIVNHGGVEIFRKKFILKHIIGSSHHERHHTEFRTNFGLYFTWWDKWMNTESKPCNRP